MDWVNPPSVGGLKWIDVDWNVIIGRRGVRHMTNYVKWLRLDRGERGGAPGPDETRALLNV